jgi:hypothetical protein
MSEDSIIWVADFLPLGEGLNHWVLWICTDPEMGLGISIDVEGFARNWERRVSQRNHPSGSARFHALVEVGGIEPEKVDKLVKWIEQNVPVNNRSDDWNCQSYVTAIVRALEERGICDEGAAGSLRQSLKQAA